jgi:hypothetical protein
MTWQKVVIEKNLEQVQYVEYYEISEERDYTRHPWKTKLTEMNSIVD